MKDIGERDILAPDDIEALVRDVLVRAGLPPSNAAPVARSIRLAESSGLRRVGLGLVPHLVEHVRSGRVNADAIPRLTMTGPATVEVDADGGFACPAVESGLGPLCDKVSSHGIAFLAVRNAYPVGSGLAFLEHCARRDLVGLARVAGLAARAAPNGSLVLEVEQRSFGPSRASGPDQSALLPVIPGRSPFSPGTFPPFEGPLGPPFRHDHCFIAVQRGLWPEDLTGPCPENAAVQNSGIAVSPGLLEKIINA